jgi:hypothetical protein
VHRATRFALAIASFALPGMAFAVPGTASTPPRALGACAFTRIAAVERRLVDERNRPVPDSGSAVRLANGVYGVSYDSVPAVEHSRRGDRVFTCLISIPARCPPHDDRGRFYTTTNLRTRESWTLPDAEHMCGGA